jgi:hypothetical protein
LCRQLTTFLINRASRRYFYRNFRTYRYSDVTVTKSNDMKSANPKYSSRTKSTKSTKSAKPAAAPAPDVELNRARLSEIAIARRVVVHLKRVEPGQTASCLDRACRSLVEQAASGDLKAVGRVIELITLLNKVRANHIEITADMPLEKASRLYLESIKRTTIDDAEDWE